MNQKKTTATDKRTCNTGLLNAAVGLFVDFFKASASV